MKSCKVILTSEGSHAKTFQLLKVVIQSYSNKLRYSHKVVQRSEASHGKAFYQVKVVMERYSNKWR